MTRWFVKIVLTYNVLNGIVYLYSFSGSLAGSGPSLGLLYLNAPVMYYMIATDISILALEIAFVSALLFETDRESLSRKIRKY